MRGEQLDMGWFRGGNTNQYSLESACDICEGVIRHQPWCIEVNSLVLEAFKAVYDGLSEADEARLAGWGVLWDGKCVRK
jgi:hypothetical protein